jgi:hypothetical protein
VVRQSNTGTATYGGTASAVAETFISGATALGFIGDSTTDRSGTGAGPTGTVEAQIVANGQGWTNDRVRVNGVTGRTINFDNGVHPTGLEQITTWRNEGFDPGTWAFALGGNGSASNQAQQLTWINDLLNTVNAGPLASYRVIIFGFARQDPADADSARFWAAMQQATNKSKTTVTIVDYNSLLHNGRSEVGLWATTAPSEAHMTTSGYTVRDQIITPYLTAPVITATRQSATGTATYGGTQSVANARQSATGTATYGGTQSVANARQSATGTATYSGTTPVSSFQGWGVPMKMVSVVVGGALTTTTTRTTSSTLTTKG